MQNPTEKLSQPDNRAGCAVADGSAFSRTPLRVQKGKWVYRNFHVVSKGWHWKILSACGDVHPAKSLADARKQIDQWYEEGSVES